MEMDSHMEASRRRSNALGATIVVSLVLHLGLIPVLYNAFVTEPVIGPKKTGNTDSQKAIHLLSQKQVQRLLAPTPPSVTRPSPPPVKKKPKPTEKPDGQIVDVQTE